MVRANHKLQSESRFRFSFGSLLILLCLVAWACGEGAYSDLNDSTDSRAADTPGSQSPATSGSSAASEETDTAVQAGSQPLTPINTSDLRATFSLNFSTDQPITLNQEGSASAAQALEFYWFQDEAVAECVLSGKWYQWRVAKGHWVQMSSTGLRLTANEAEATWFQPNNQTRRFVCAQQLDSLQLSWASEPESDEAQTMTLVNQSSFVLQMNSQSYFWFDPELNLQLTMAVIQAANR